MISEISRKMCTLWIGKDKKGKRVTNMSLKALTLKEKQAYRARFELLLGPERRYAWKSPGAQRWDQKQPASDPKAREKDLWYTPDPSLLVLLLEQLPFCLSAKPHALH